jgi:hypothetical protein
MQFPEAVIRCLSLEIDLASMLGAKVAAGGGFTTGQGVIQHDGFTLSMKSLAGADFDPPRPLLLGPIFQDAEKYKGYDKTTHHTMTFQDDSGRSVTKEGDFTVKVKKFSADYVSTVDGKTLEFHDVLWWEMTSNFDTPAKHGLTFKKWEWFWNMRPLMIPGLKIEGTIGDFATGEGMVDADELLGTMTFELYVKDYEME